MGARKAYATALTKTTAAELLAGAQRYILSDNVRRGFVCLPASWLNGERWTDQGTQVTPQQGEMLFAINGRALEPEQPANNYRPGSIDHKRQAGREKLRKMGAI